VYNNLKKYRVNYIFDALTCFVISLYAFNYSILSLYFACISQIGLVHSSIVPPHRLVTSTKAFQKKKN